MSQLKVTLVRGIAGKTKRHRAILKGLGLRKSQHSVILDDTPAVRGAIGKVSHLLSVEPADGAESKEG